MEKIYKDGEVLEATDLNGSFSELETKINKFIEEYTRDPFIIIDGKKYPISGVMTNPGGWSYSANYSGNYNGTITVNAPYPAPEGYIFEIFCVQTTGFTHISTCTYNRQAAKIEGRIYQGGSNQLVALDAIGWRLIPESTDPNRLANQ